MFESSHSLCTRRGECWPFSVFLIRPFKCGRIPAADALWGVTQLCLATRYMNSPLPSFDGFGRDEHTGSLVRSLSCAATHYVVNDGGAHFPLWSWLWHLGVEDDREQSPPRDGALLCLVKRNMSSQRPFSRCAFDALTTEGFSVVFLVCNENSSHLLKVRPEGSICFAVWALVAAVAVFPFRSVLVD